MYQVKLNFSIFSKIVSNNPYRLGLFQTRKKNQREANGGNAAAGVWGRVALNEIIPRQRFGFDFCNMVSKNTL